MRHLRWGVYVLLRLLPRLLGPLLILLPVTYLAFTGGNAFLKRADALLAQSTPLIAAEVSRLLRRPVEIGGFTPNLTVRKLYDYLTRPEAYGSLPVVITDLRIGNRAEERRFAGDDTLVTVGQATLFVSLPDALGGKWTSAVSRILVEDARGVVYRDPQGRLNLSQILPPQDLNRPPQPPFRTRVEVRDSSVRFRDYAAPFPRPQLPQVNAVFVPSAIIDLTGTRTIGFSVSARALSGTVTAQRLGGPLNVEGTARRGNPGDLPDGPTEETPVLLARLSARDAFLPYWLAYVLPTLKGYRLTRGQGDADLSLYLPPQPRNAPIPAPEISLRAAFRGVDARATAFAIGAERAQGSLEFADGYLRFITEARVLGEPVTARGALWNIGGATASTPPGSAAPGAPRFQVDVDAPRVPVGRVLSAVLPRRQTLPPELTLGGNATVQASVVGAATGKLQDLTAVGDISGLRGSWKGYPGIDQARAHVLLAGGIVRMTGATAQVAGQGTVTGEGTLQLNRGGGIGDGAFAVRADRIDLARFNFLQEWNRRSAAGVRLQGIGSAEAVGRLTNGRITAAANVSTTGLQVGEIPFPVARARILVENNQIIVPAARLESPVGVVRVNGDVAPGGALRLRFAGVSLDLLALGQAFGVDGISGLVSLSGSVRGSVASPVVNIEQLLGLNLRWRASTGENNASRQFAIDTLFADGVTITRERLVLTRPLVVRRLPALAIIDGEIGNLLPAAPDEPFNPRLNLTAYVENLDYAEIQRQIEASQPAPASRSALVAGNRTPVLTDTAELPWNAGTVVSRQGKGTVIRSNRDLPPIAASIQTAIVQVRGTLADPRVAGTVTLDNILIGPYPVEGGQISFDFSRRRTILREAALTASVGTVRASVTVDASGNLSGQVNAPNLDVEKLSFLTRGLFRFQGSVSINAELSGNVRRPTVVADVTAPLFTVSGTQYANIRAEGIRFTGGEGGRGGEITLPELTFSRGATQVRLADARYDLTRGNVAGVLTVQNGDVGTILETIRRSGLDQTEQGAGIVRAITSLPTPTDARFDVNRLAVRGRVTPKGFENPQVDADISATNIEIGRVTADRLTLKGSLRDGVIRVADPESPNLPGLLITRPGATIRGGGTYDPEGTVNAYIESNEASLDIIRSIPGLEGFPVRGAVDFSVSVSGNSKKPQVLASLLGNDLLLVTGRAANQQSAPVAAVSARTEEAIVPSGIRLSLVRIEAEMAQDEMGRLRVIVPGALVKVGNAEATIRADLPVTTNAQQESVAQRPLTFAVTTNEIDLNELYRYWRNETLPAVADNQKKASKDTETTNNAIRGKVVADFGFGGSLENPALSGLVRVTDAQINVSQLLRPFLPGAGNDTISSITDFDADLRLSGGRVLFDTFSLKLGGLNNRRGNFGSLNIGGSIAVQSLEQLEQTLRRTTDQQPGNRRRRNQPFGSYDLTLAFNEFKPEIDNILGLKEAARGRINGELRMTGDLLEPLISTPRGKPLQVTEVEIRTPSGELAETSENRDPVALQPTFDVAVVVPDTAVVSSPGTFRFEARSTQPTTIQGNPFATTGNPLRFEAALYTVGGYFQLPTSRFTVQKGGEINIGLGTESPGIEVTNVVATGKISTRRGQSLGVGRNTAVDALTALSDPTTPATRYDITLTLNGPLNLLNDQADPRNARQLKMDFTSNPPLSDAQILALLGAQNALELARNGRLEEAFNSFAAQALASSYLPQYLSQITGGVAETLGLDDLTVDYNIDESLGLRVQKRLPDPLERFIVDYSRTLQQRNTPSRLLPFNFQLSYELYQFNTSQRLLPRLQLGFSTNEQNTLTYFLQGTIFY